MNKSTKSVKVLTIGQIDIGKILFANRFLIMVMLFPFFKTDGFSFLPILPLISNTMLVIECVFFLTLVFF
jgi:hypothetical protein